MAQNLVPNPGFETLQSCPANTNQLTICTGNWIANSLYSPDYFNSCAPGIVGAGVGIPHNNFGYQLPSGGDAYAGFYAYLSQFAGAREFISTQLTSPLTIGQKYYVRFKVSAAYKNSGNPSLDPTLAVSNLGLLFTVNNPTTSLILLSNNAHVFTTSVASDTADWTVISGSYTATENSQYITIGNHFQDGAIQIQGIVQPGTSGAAYYYIDDVCVSADSMDCISMPVGLQNRQGENTISVYPNPASDIIQVDIPAIYQKNAYTLCVRNIAGAEVLHAPATEPMVKFSTQTLGAKGLYFLELRDRNQRRINSVKIMVQ